MVEKYLDAISKNNEDVEGFMMVERGLLGSAIYKLLESGYEPHLVGAGDDRKDDYEKQVDYIKNSEISDRLPKGFKIVETPRTSSATDVREKLLDNDFAGFKKLVPKEVSNYYNNLVSMIREAE